MYYHFVGSALKILSVQYYCKAPSWNRLQVWGNDERTPACNKVTSVLAARHIVLDPVISDSTINVPVGELL